MLKQVTDYTIIETNDIRRIDIEFKFGLHNGNELCGSEFTVGYVFNIKLHCGEEIHGDFDVIADVADTYFDVFEKENIKGGIMQFSNNCESCPTWFQTIEAIEVKRMLLRVFKTYLLDDTIDIPFDRWVWFYIKDLPENDELSIKIKNLKETMSKVVTDRMKYYGATERRKND